MNFEKLIDFGKKHIEWFTILGLCILCYFIFFHNIGNYALMDVDETRYVSMSRDMFNTKDFLTLYLNGDYFFEKPPLYFWSECMSFAIFGKINEFTARFPVALYGTLLTFLTYFVGRKIVNRKVGITSALILATSLEFVILAKFAILDIVVSTCVGFSTLFGFMTFFSKEQNKKYFWWLFYIFSGLAVMAKGIPGFVVPFGTMFFASIVSKKFKEIFKPQYFLVGFILFFLITIPWHAIMLNMHDPLFFDEYIIKHHLARFLGSKELGREQPFYFYFLTFLWGMVPWIFSMLAVGVAKCKKFAGWKTSLQEGKLFSSLKEFDFNNLDNKHKFLTLNWIGFWVVMLFFSSSSTKLITYILPVYVFAAGIMGVVWYDYIESKMHQKAINISIYIVGGIFALAGFIAIFAQLFLPAQLYSDIQSAQLLCVFLLLGCGIGTIISAKKQKYCIVFIIYVLFMAGLSGFGTKEFFNIDYKFGQNDLIKYAKMSAENNQEVITNGFGRRYSLIYYSKDKKVEFNTDLNIPQLEKDIKNTKNMVIVRTKNLDEIKEQIDYEIVEQGRKYSIIKGNSL